MPRRRDPDALPPGNLFEALINVVYKGILTLRGGNTLFAIKAAILTGESVLLPSAMTTPSGLTYFLKLVLLCLPSFFKSTGSFAYGM